MAQILVTSSELRTAAGTLREYNNDFKRQVEDLVNSEGQLKTQWQGPANDAFHTAFMNDKSFMDKFAAEIERYCQTLETIASKYDAAEAANVETAATRRY
ncbi:MAG: WXG100 family type VII secretion target [Lachnospiraceae bacterium]|nr:WXG100 family type VII secretion target [Lachnospiraceae bacterium]